MAKLSKQDAEKYCEGLRGKPQFNELTSFISSDLVLAIEILSENSINKVKELANSIRSKFATDQLKQAVLCSESSSAAAKEIDLFFSASSPLQSPAYFNNCSCLVVKPHLIT